VTVNILIVLGTRPEIIKISPIIHELERSASDFNILHTGQHYSYAMDQIFFEQLELPKTHYNLTVGSGTHAEQTGKMLIGIEKVLLDEQPDAVLVEGDTNSALAGAMAAVKLGIKVGHVEAGLRCYDKAMHEEINRIIVDHCSDLLFAPTQKSMQILQGEGILDDKIFVTGNTIVDAINLNLEISKRKENILLDLGLTKEDYFLATIHRQENVDNEERFRNILKGLEMVGETFDCDIVYPIHPRAQKQVTVFNINMEGIRLVDPLDYLSFLQLESNAKLVLTDSGGVQEETCIMKVPSVTLRDNTERPETLEVGSNVLSGASPNEIVKKTEQMLRTRRDWTNPFGNGRAGEAIVEVLKSSFG
jgi:UDP-N-acetylglucosamine 2-epimerase (non-hydrolysing)